MRRQARRYRAEASQRRRRQHEDRLDRQTGRKVVLLGRPVGRDDPFRVVPVAVLGAASAQEAAAIASAADPALAWFGGASAPAGTEGGRRIARNNALYDRWGVDAVPLIAWRARDGRIAHRLGDIDDLGAWLGALPHE